MIDRCLNGARDCDGNPRNGCEVSIDDVNNCGSCGRVCDVENGRAACDDGECSVGSCDMGFANCDDDSESCETRTNTLTDCGGCGVACSDVANAAPSCESGRCGVGTCAAGFADCDDRGDNGCETELGSLANCGACGQRCEKASCAGGVCTAIDCGMTPGRADCDGDEATCEVNLREDLDNCGRCGFKCAFTAGVTPHASLACTESGCRARCDDGYGDCDGDYRNGCEQSLNTNNHCGMCRRACNITNAMETCGSGSCQLSQCDQNYADCDGDKTSCEVAINTTMNCGMCGRACNLAHATPECPNRTCEVASCEPNWGNCDGRGDNGCEQDVRSVADGGAGPCWPDTECSRATNAGRTYFVCSNLRSWQDARARCRVQRNGDLAHIGSEAEAMFVSSRLSSPAWVGLNDLERNGVWTWVHNEVPIWQGAANGRAVGTAFNTWAAGEPNASGHCVQLYTGGDFDDTDCGGTRPYVCELNPDGCPNDPKTDPGQCGCSTPDEDADNDGFAQCNDMCPSDPNKRVPGDCNCGNADTDRDDDDAADCIDNCDDDPNKREPGVCGCGRADTDSDADGTPNCNDGCPNDPATTEGCFPYDPTNVDPAPLDWDGAPSATLNCGTTTVNTADPPTLQNWCGTQPRLSVQNQAGGPAVVVVTLAGLSIPANNNLRLVGPRPVVFAVMGDVDIAGTIDASANGATAGAGGNWQCGGSSGGDGSGDSSSGASGGGGGGFGSAGGSGGSGEGRNGGSSGASRGNGELTPLLGGCNGGLGGGCGDNPRAAGGGAVQLSASGTVRVTGAIRANGAQGANGCGSEGGGSGGGSGGAVFIEARTIQASNISVNGGNGGDSDGRGGNGSSTVGNSGGNGENSGANGGSGGGGGAGRFRTLMR